MTPLPPSGAIGHMLLRVFPSAIRRWFFCFVMLPAAGLAVRAADTGSSFASNAAVLSAAPFPKEVFTQRPSERRDRALMEACYKSIRMWQGVVYSRTQPVPGKAGCLYLGDKGNEENDIRPIAYAALVNAFISKVGTAHAKPSPQECLLMREEALGFMRYLVQGHVTGTGRCVNGKQWGKHWQSAMWTRSLGLAAWMLWDDLPGELQRQIADLVAFEADRFVAAAPKSSVHNDTGAEENAWNAQILSLAGCMLPKHPRAAQWREAAKRWMYNSLSVPQDHEDETPGDDNKPVRQWVNTTNVHSDFTIENHGIVHMGYLKTSASLLVENAIPYLLTGNAVPKATLHHADDCFEVLLRCMGWDAATVYVSGNDWKLFHTQATDAMLYALMNLLGRDARAAYLEELALDYTLKIQETEHGFYNVRRDVESGGLLSTRLIAAYLAHAVLGAGMKPVSERTFNNAVSGVFYFPEANFVVHRTPTKFVSASLSQKRMLLAFPENGSWVVWPQFASGPGYINGQEPSSRNAKLLGSRVETNNGGFRVSGVLARAGGAVEQSFLFASLADDTVVYIERLRIQENTLKSRETGVVGVEYDLGRNVRTLITAGGRTKITGVGGDAAKTISLPADWLNIDNRVGYIVKRFPERANVMRYHDEVSGSGRVPQLQEWLSLIGEAESARGDDWACVLIFLNQRATATARQASNVEFVVQGDTGICRFLNAEVRATFSP